MMRPQFDDTLTISDDGQTVHASGPLALDDEDREAYMWVRIAQTDGDNRTFAAEINHEIKEADVEAILTESSAGRTWSVDVKAEQEARAPQDPSQEEQSGPSKFVPGRAHAEAWIVYLRKEGPGTLHIWWWENVELVSEAPAS
jgi:hypothetical protein